VLVAALAAVVTDLLLQPRTGPGSNPIGQPAQVLTPAVSWLVNTPQPSADTAPIPLAEPCTAPAGWGVYEVRAGDTLFLLAQRFGADVPTLKRVNCLETATIFAGQALYVPWQEGLPTAEASNSDFPVVTPTASVAGGDGPIIPDHYLHILLLATDIRPEGRRRDGSWRTDSIIVLSVDLTDRSARLLHVPRDLWVSIPGGGQARLNTVEMTGEIQKPGSGPDLVKQTIYSNLGIPIHYYAQVDFATFPQIIDSLGGLDLDVACPVPEIGLTESGVMHMNGEQVLSYAQRRDTSSDFDRGIRQRQILMALKEQVLTPAIIPRIPQLWNAMSGSFKTDIPFDEVINLAYVGIQMDSADIVQRDIGGRHVRDWVAPDGQMVLLPRQDKIQGFLREVYAPLRTDRVRATGKARVQVVNSSQRRDADQLAAAALRRAGFKVAESVNSTNSQQVAKTQIIILKGDPIRGERLATELQIPLSALQDYTAVAEPPDFSNPVDIKVILGQDYDPCWR